MKQIAKTFHLSIVLTQDEDGVYRVEMHPRAMKADTMQVIASFLVASLISTCENGPIASINAIMTDANSMIEKHKQVPFWPGW